MIKKHWKGFIIILLIIVVFTVIYFNKKNSDITTTQDKIDPRMVVEVQKGMVRDTISAEGFIEPINEENLTFPAKSGGSVKIEKIHVKEGDKVKEGQLLIELDKKEARLNYIQRQNAYNRALINGSQNDIEEAKLNLELVENNLANLDLKAPFDGIITDIYLEEGGYYSSGEVATIKDISRLQIKVSIQESDIPIIRVGQAVEMTLISLPGVKIEGLVHKLGEEASVSGASVTLPVTILLDEVENDIKLGVSAQLDIIVDEVKDKVVVPLTAVFSKNGRDYVIKVLDGKTEEIAVETGLSDGLNIIIESGLETGDEILINTFNFAPDYRTPGGMGGAGFFVGGRR